MIQDFKLIPTGKKIEKEVRLLVFQIGRYKMAAVIDQIRTIVDINGEVDEIIYDSDFNCSYTSGNISVNCVDLHRLIFPNEYYEAEVERKLIVVKTAFKTLNGILVDKIFGVGMFTDLYPFPQGAFTIGDGLFTYVVTNEEPWFEVIDLPHVIENYNFQPARIENG